MDVNFSPGETSLRGQNCQTKWSLLMDSFCIWQKVWFIWNILTSWLEVARIECFVEIYFQDFLRRPSPQTQASRLILIFLPPMETLHTEKYSIHEKLLLKILANPRPPAGSPAANLTFIFIVVFFIWFNSLKSLFISPRRPPAGSPAANSSFKPAEISDTIDFSRGLPGFLFVLFSLGPRFFVFYFSFSPIGWKCFFFSGTKYDFWLYYSNSTISDWLTWTGEQT